VVEVLPTQGLRTHFLPFFPRLLSRPNKWTKEVAKSKETKCNTDPKLFSLFPSLPLNISFTLLSLGVFFFFPLSLSSVSLSLFRRRRKVKPKRVREEKKISGSAKTTSSVQDRMPQSTQPHNSQRIFQQCRHIAARTAASTEQNHETSRCTHLEENLPTGEGRPFPPKMHTSATQHCRRWTRK
jgi:hypothetical protein